MHLFFLFHPLLSLPSPPFISSVPSSRPSLPSLSPFPRPPLPPISTADHRSTINQAIDARAVSAPPPLVSDVRIPCAGGVAPEGESLPEHASAGAQGEPPKKANYSVGTQAQSRNKYDGGNDSTANTDIRRNEFHTLQDEMHQKRAVGMRWGVNLEGGRGYPV